MAHIFRFNKSDKIINLVKTHPKVSYYFYSGSAYYNNQYNLSGAFSASILGVPSGYVSLYEQNVDRSGFINFSSGLLSSGKVRDPFGYAVSASIDPRTFYEGANPRYATFKAKDGTRINFKTVTNKQFNVESNIGEVISKDYPLSASIQKYFYTASASRSVTSSIDNSEASPSTPTGS